jgi:hypothetical protein
VDASRVDLERFYALMARLAAAPFQGRRLDECGGSDPWPSRGVYFLTEPGEYRSFALRTPRITRVGTHAISAGAKGTLWSRLRTHRGVRKGGGGNHRGSIFRLHVGAALLARDGGRLDSWGVGSTATAGVRLTEAEHERRVSSYIGRMALFWVGIPDEPGAQSARAFVERNAIALLSNHLEPIDQPSNSWLGRSSPRAEIRRSALWNLNHVSADYDPAFLPALETFVAISSASLHRLPL